MGSDGSARPISGVNFKDNKISFSIPPQWDTADEDLVVETDLKDGILVRTMNQPDGEIPVEFINITIATLK